MTNEFNEELTKIARDLYWCIFEIEPYYTKQKKQLENARNKIARLNDLIRKINEELN